MLNPFSNPTSIPITIPIEGKYMVIQMQEFSDRGNRNLSFENSLVTFISGKIIFTDCKTTKEYIYDVIEVLCEDQAKLSYLINTIQQQKFLLVLNEDELFKITSPHLAKLTTEDGTKGILYSLQTSMFL